MNGKEDKDDTKKTIAMALEGISSRGKTSTLYRLMQMLDPDDSGNDCAMVGGDKAKLIKYRGKIIYIATAGDSEEILKKIGMNTANHTADLYICACRTQGGTHTYLEQEFDQVVYVGREYIKLKMPSPWQGYLEKEFQRKQATHLLDLIESILKI